MADVAARGDPSSRRRGEELLRRQPARQLRESAALSRPTLELLAEYSPQIPCMITGLPRGARQLGRQIKGALGRGVLHHRRAGRGYTPRDGSSWATSAPGPPAAACPTRRCPYPAVDLDDGVARDPGLASDDRGPRGGARASAGQRWVLVTTAAVGLVDRGARSRRPSGRSARRRRRRTYTAVFTSASRLRAGRRRDGRRQSGSARVTEVELDRRRNRAGSASRSRTTCR